MTNANKILNNSTEDFSDLLAMWIGNKKYVQVLILILFPFFIYFKTIHFGFVGLDDTTIIKGNLKVLGDIHKVKSIFFSDAFIHNPGRLFYRPIQNLSFMLDTLAGNGQLWVYHLSSLIIHILTVISLYILLNLLYVKSVTSFVFSLIFSIHPLLASDISWLPSRGDLLLGLIGIWIFITYIKYQHTGKIRYIFLNFFLYSIGVFTKETCIIFPIVLMGYSFFILDKRKTKKELIGFNFIWLFIILIYFHFRNIVIHTIPKNDYFSIHTFCINLKSIPVIIGKIFVPQNLSTLPIFDNTSLIIGVIFLVAVLYLGVIEFIENEWGRIFWLIWFVLFTLPPLTVRFKSAEYFFEYLEHRAYLPLIGFIVFLALCSAKYLSRIKSSLIFISVLILLFFLSVIASTHSSNYYDSISFYTAAIKANPTKAALAYTNRGYEYLDMKEYNKAIADQNSAVSIFKSSNMYFNRGYTYMLKGDTILAINDFNSALKLDSNKTICYIYRASIYDGQKKYDLAMKDIIKAEKINNKIGILFCKKGNILLHMGFTEEAIVQYNNSIKLDNKLFEAYISRAKVYTITKDYQKAIIDYNSALSFNKENKEIYNSLGLIYSYQCRNEKSVECFNIILKVNSLDKDAFFARALVEQKAGKLSNACADWKTALQLGIKTAQDSLNKYCK